MSPLGKVYHPLVGNQDQLRVGSCGLASGQNQRGWKPYKKHQGEIHQEKIRVIDQRIMAQFKAPQTKD